MRLFRKIDVNINRLEYYDNGIGRVIGFAIYNDMKYYGLNGICVKLYVDKLGRKYHL